MYLYVYMCKAEVIRVEEAIIIRERVMEKSEERNMRGLETGKRRGKVILLYFNLKCINKTESHIAFQMK